MCVVVILLYFRVLMLLLPLAWAGSGSSTTYLQVHDHPILSAGTKTNARLDARKPRPLNWVNR